MRVALLLLLTFAGVATASPEQAKAHFKQGKAYQDAGAFERAAEEYKLAYAEDPQPEMLFNLGQVYRLAKNKQAAIDYFKQ